MKLALLTAIFGLSSYVLAACYYPNGNIGDDISCNESVGETFCCGAGWACLSNKLCWSDNTYARGSCTDQTCMKPPSDRALNAIPDSTQGTTVVLVRTSVS